MGGHHRPCIQDGCKIRPRYALKGHAKGVYCNVHRPNKSDWIVVTWKATCRSPDCNLGPTYALHGKGTKEYCQKHRPNANYISTGGGLCKVEGCTVRASFGSPNRRTADRCKKHAPPTWVSLRGTKCKECNIRASFSKSPGLPAEFCKVHRPEGYISHGRSCDVDDCKQLATYTNDGEKYFCHIHRADNMETTKIKTCSALECFKAGYWFLTNNPSEVWCFEHRPASAERKQPIRVLCKEDGCKTRPSYGIAGTKDAIYCKAHASPTMHADVVSQLCTYPDVCFRHAAQHKLCLQHTPHTRNANAKNTNTQLCIVCNDRFVYYGFHQLGAQYCVLDRPPGTIARPNKRCITDGCFFPAEWGVRLHDHCEMHKMDGEHNVVARKCLRCGLMGSLGLHDICETCDPKLHESKRLQKQRVMVEYLNMHELAPDSVDRILDKGICGRERPDIYYENKNQPHWVIGECDEYQHDGMECSRICTCDGRHCGCDISRMKDIAYAQGGRSGYFIRYNPDPFKGTKVSEAARLAVLAKWIAHLLKTPPKGFIEVLYLFYDGYIQTDEPSILIDWDECVW